MELGNVELRPYQQRDVGKFLDVPACLIAYGKRGGKTITSLALTLQRLERYGINRPVLIVGDKDSPWTRDLAKIGFPPDKLHRIYADEITQYKRAKAKDAFRGLLTNAQPGHFYQVHWSALVPELELLRSVKWHTIIADEFHAAKNRKAQRTKALKRLRTEYKIGLTADPDDNVPQDIWSLLNWLYPKQYSSYWKWVRKYVEIEEVDGPRGSYIKYGAPINVGEFRTEIEPFFVYMPLEEIDPGQLPHIYEEHHVDMTTGQQQAYDQMLEWQIMSLGDGDDDIVVGEWGMVAAMRLQQLAQAMGRIERREVHRWVIEDDPDTGQRIRVNKTITTVRVGQIEPSPKLDDMISTLLDTERQCGPTIIFTQFADMVGLACRRMDRAGLKYVSVQQNSEINRAEIAFQTGEVDIIIGTVGLISESIDLARATTEIFIDCPWNPRVRGQAEDRAREYGKRTAVRIIDIRTRDSVDFARLDRVRTKQEWKDALLGRKRLGNGDA